MISNQVGAVLVAGGKSSRLNLGKRKPYLPLAGREVFLRTVDVFAGLDFIKDIALVVNVHDLEEVRATWGTELQGLGVFHILAGGDTRQESVRKGVMALSHGCDWVAIHDAVRPFVTPEAVEDVVARACDCGAAILAVPMKDTVKHAGRGQEISETVPREHLWLAQTPQVFPRAKYLELSARAEKQGWEATDDAQIFEKARNKVALVEGSYDNIKVTTESDWRIAKALAESRPNHLT